MVKSVEKERNTKMSEKIKAVLRDEKKISKSLFVVFLVVMLVVIFDLPALFNAFANQYGYTTYGYTENGYGVGYGYWSESSPSLALTYGPTAACSSGCQYSTNQPIIIRATFFSVPAGVPQVSIDLPGTTNDVSWSDMSGGMNVWAYAYTTANVSTTSTATVSVRTIQGLGNTPTPSNSTFSITVAGGGASTGSVYYDSTAPAISNVAVTAGTTEATIAWTTNEASLTWVQYGVSSSYGSEVKGSAFYTSHSVKLSGLTPGATYHYLVRSRDGSSSGNEGSDVDRTFSTYKTQEEADKAVEEAAKEEVTTPTEETTETAETTEAATTEETVTETVVAVPARPEKPDLKKELDGLVYFIKTTKKLPSAAADWSIVHFIAYGTDNTANLTAAERKDIITDYSGIYGHVPSDAQGWADVDSMATGVKPATRVLKAEQNALKDFTRVYGRLPNFSVAGDDLAMGYLAYKLRAATRDLTVEKSATSVFKGIYKVNPTTSAHWAVVRALAYSGAKR
jgi:hypothetical protein